MKFKIPDSYVIAGVKHTVIMEEDLAINAGRRGESTYFIRRCHIDVHLTPAEQRRTLIHEALHHIDSLFVTDLKEAQIQRLATGVAELIQQLEPENEEAKSGDC